MSHLDEVKLWLDVQKPHIFGLNETRLDNSVTDENIDIEGYSVLRKDCNRFDEGCVIYIDNNVTFERREDLDDDLESVSTELLFPNIRPIIYTCLHRPPKSTVELFNKIEILFSKVEQENKEHILSGDLNCDSFDQQLNQTKHLKNIYNSFNCKLLITEATRTTADTNTLIDHIITNKPEQIITSGVLPCGISDHDVTYTVRSYKKLRNSRCKPKTLTTRKFNKFDTDAFLKDLERVPLDEIKHHLIDPNEMWMIWNLFH